jgi:hypothetical protein
MIHYAVVPSPLAPRERDGVREPAIEEDEGVG